MQQMTNVLYMKKHNKKCNGCFFETQTMYSFFKDKIDDGLCKSCMNDVILNQGGNDYDGKLFPNTIEVIETQ